MYNQSNATSTSRENRIIDRVKELKGKRNSTAYTSNDALANAIGYSSRTVKAWLAGENPFPVEALLKICDLFQCDIGYLTGEIDTPRHITTDVCEATGLSEDAANALINEPFSGFYDTLIKMTSAQVEEPKEYFSVPTCLYADFLELKQIHQLKKIYEDGIDSALQKLFSSAYSRYKIEKTTLSGFMDHETKKRVFRLALASILQERYKESQSEFKNSILSCSCKKPALVQLGISTTFEEDILNSDDCILSFVRYFADPVFQYFERTRENTALLENKLQTQFMNIIHYMLENVELTHKKGR